MRHSKLFRTWVIPSLVASIFGALLTWAGIALISVDNGANLCASSRIIKERVITEKVNVYQKDSTDFLYYLGEEYRLPQDQVIFVGETLQELQGLSSTKVTKTICFDENEQDYIYKEDIFNYSFVIAKSKRSMEITSSICFVLGILVFIIDIFTVFLSFLVVPAFFEE